MIEIIARWVAANYIEVLGAVLGMVYIVLSIRQNILTWLTGLLTSVFYIYIFFVSKFYADMGLQVYYVFVSIYGWYYWLKGKHDETEKQVPVSQVSLKQIAVLSGVSVLIYFVILHILLNYTDSPVPYADSLTTALSIVATWMLARKILEHWIVWVFVDAFSALLYIYKGLWPTTILFVVYTVMAVLGYIEWKKELRNQSYALS